MSGRSSPQNPKPRQETHRPEPRHESHCADNLSIPSPAGIPEPISAGSQERITGYTVSPADLVFSAAGKNQLDLPTRTATRPNNVSLAVDLPALDAPAADASIGRRISAS
jgi:hypothetical protein